MKLAILYQSLPIYRKDFFEHLNEQLKDREIDLTVIHGTGLLKKSIKHDEAPNYDVIRLETVEFKLLGFNIAWWKGVFKSIKRIKPEIIIIHPPPGNIIIWFVHFYCYLNRIIVGMWGSSYVRKDLKGIKRKIRNRIFNFFKRRADFHLCYGTKLKDELLDLGIKESKIFIAQNTINVERILNLEIEANEKQLRDNSIIVFVGALIPEKNLDLAIKAIARLVREKYNLIFNIIGQGAIIEDLRALVSEEGMGKNIFVMGPKYGSELTSYFVDADFYLLPGTGGLGVNEAMAYGLPIVSTIGDDTIVDLLYEGKNGFYLDDAPSIDNIYFTCKKAIEMDKSKLSELGKSSKQIVSEKATLQKMVSSFETAIQNEISNE